jgi:ABC-type glycerol-3-phosphate transport system substrate-binding protein
MDKTTLGLGVDETVDGFKSGVILSCNVGTQRASAIKSSDLNDNIASAPIPGFKEGVPAPPLVAGQSLGIGKYAQDPEASFDFIKYFYSAENQKKWLKANVMTVRTAIYDDEEIKALSNYDELQAWSNYAATGSVVFYPEDYTELSINLVKAAQMVIFQGADAKAELDEVVNWYNEKNGK